VAHASKWARMAVLSLQNALQLHRDSIVLFQRRSYGSATSLSVLASEEIGKYFLVEDLVWRSGVEGPRSREDEEAWLKLAYDHHAKQGQFAWIGRRALPKALCERALRGGLEREKQRGLYVGLPRRGKRLNLLGRISTPKHVRRRGAEIQITAVNDFLIVFASGCAEGSLILDIPAAERLLSLRLARSLRLLWPPIGSAAKRYVQRTTPELIRKSAGPNKGLKADEA
jgi:AbiV family abortive infection protein